MTFQGSRAQNRLKNMRLADRSNNSAQRDEFRFSIANGLLRSFQFNIPY